MMSDLRGLGQVEPSLDNMVHYFHCPYCGAGVEVTESSEAELPNYPIYQDMEANKQKANEELLKHGEIKQTRSGRKSSRANK